MIYDIYIYMCVCQYILVHVKKTLSLLIHGIVQFSALGIQAQGPHGDSTVPGTADAETARDVETQGLDRDLGRPINVLGIFELLLKSIRYRNIYIYIEIHTQIYICICVFKASIGSFLDRLSVCCNISSGSIGIHLPSALPRHVDAGIVGGDLPGFHELR